MRVKGTATLTSSMSVACTPAMKKQLEEAAAARGVNPSVIARWATQDWLDAHETTGTTDTETETG